LYLYRNSTRELGSTSDYTGGSGLRDLPMSLLWLRRSATVYCTQGGCGHLDLTNFNPRHEKCPNCSQLDRASQKAVLYDIAGPVPRKHPYFWVLPGLDSGSPGHLNDSGSCLSGPVRPPPASSRVCDTKPAFCAAIVRRQPPA
jgi:hypothetical protein